MNEMSDMSEVTLEEVQQRLDQGEDPDELFQLLQGIWAKRSSLKPEQVTELRECVALVAQNKPRQVF